MRARNAPEEEEEEKKKVEVEKTEKKGL